MRLRNKKDDNMSNELWQKIRNEMENVELGSYSARLLCHLMDSTERGYITPLEAYDALDAEYWPEWLKVRKSAFMHTI